MGSVAPTPSQELMTFDPDDLCHIAVDGSSVHAYCGRVDKVGEGVTCQDYDGEAICPTCGLPTCPACARLAALEEALDSW